MREIKTEVVIDSTASDVWKILMDFERYPEWNPFIKSISGEPGVGENCELPFNRRTQAE